MVSSSRREQSGEVPCERREGGGGCGVKCLGEGHFWRTSGVWGLKKEGGSSPRNVGGGVRGGGASV